MHQNLRFRLILAVSTLTILVLIGSFAGTYYLVKNQLTTDQQQKSQVIDLLALQVQNTNQMNGSILFNNDEYYYQKSLTTNDQKESVTVLYWQQDPKLLNSLPYSFSIIAFIAVIVSILAGVIIADKAVFAIQETQQKQKDFLATASNKFRSPLAIIHTNLEVIRDNPLETVQSQEVWLNNIYDETGFMINLFDEMLFLARTDGNLQKLYAENFSLSTTLQIATELFRSIASRHGIDLDAQIAPGINYWGDTSKLNMAIRLLFEQALNRTPTGGKITFVLNRSKQTIQLSVADNGAGIHPKFLATIFERFSQPPGLRSSLENRLGIINC